ncbi:MAG: sugar ABC transporter substrate-binding protein, partial [Thermoprotei archaeon]
ITITVWTIGPDPPSEYRLKNFFIAEEMLNKYLETLGANVRVKVEGEFFVSPVEWEEYKKKFYLAYEAGEAPDIYLTGHEDIGFLAEEGMIIPLDEYIAEYWNNLSYYNDIIPTLWEAVKWKGKIYAIPQDTEARPLYFRKDVLRKLGWSEEEIEALPERIRKGEFTLYDLLKVAKEAVDKGLVERGLVHRVKEGWDYLQFYLGFGGRLWDPETGKMVFSQEAWKKTLKWFYDAVWGDYKGVIWSGQFSFDWTKDFHLPITKGTALFCSGGTWHKAEWIKKGLITEEEFWKNIGFALHPAGEPGKKPVTLSHPLIYTITSQAKERGKDRIAFLLITLVTSPTLNSIHSVESAHLAIMYSQITNSIYVRDPFLKKVAYMLDYTTFIPNHPKWADYSRLVFETIRAVETGELGPEDAYEFLLEELKKALGDALIIEP